MPETFDQTSKEMRRNERKCLKAQGWQGSWENLGPLLLPAGRCTVEVLQCASKHGTQPNLPIKQPSVMKSVGESFDVSSKRDKAVAFLHELPVQLSALAEVLQHSPNTWVPEKCQLTACLVRRRSDHSSKLEGGNDATPDSFCADA